MSAWFLQHITPEARRIVLAVLKPHPVLGLTSREIFQASIEQFPDAKSPVPPPKILQIGVNGNACPIPPPPYPEHPIRSMKYLKKVVLEEMLKGDIERIHIRMGLPDQDGNRQDVLSSKVHGKSIVPNAAKKQLEWRWRLMLEKLPQMDE